MSNYQNLSHLTKNNQKNKRDEENKHLINSKLDEGNAPVLLSAEEMRQVLINPLSESRYKTALAKNGLKRTQPDIVCDVCGKTYTKHNVSHHRQTKHHQLMASLNKRLMKVLTNDF